MQQPDNRRILIVDDNDAIHGDFKKILAAAAANRRCVRGRPCSTTRRPRQWALRRNPSS